VQPPPIIAHRTCPYDAPENSLEGIAVAHRQGADGVEVDLRLSLDGAPFLMHDKTLRRMAGPRLPLEAVPSFILRRLRLKGSRETIPTLAAAFDALPPGMFIAVDVKTPWGVRALLRETRRRGWEDRVLAWCTSARACAYMTSRAPEIETAYLNDALAPGEVRRFLETALAVRAHAISAHWLAVSAELVAAAHERGLKVYSCHFRHDLSPAKLRSGLDALITDHPAEARRAYLAL
jgi:glycerophosphoryl diester phosphodiesterase